MSNSDNSFRFDFGKSSEEEISPTEETLELAEGVIKKVIDELRMDGSSSRSSLTKEQLENVKNEIKFKRIENGNIVFINAAGDRTEITLDKLNIDLNSLQLLKLYEIYNEVREINQDAWPTRKYIAKLFKEHKDTVQKLNKLIEQYKAVLQNIPNTAQE